MKAGTQVSKTDSSAKIGQVAIVANKLVSETGFSVGAFTFGDTSGEVVADGYAPSLVADSAKQTACSE
ncbi:hypothetical protein AS29_008320 [Bacillus sp. SJS]|nr:hypothetical protein AS29_008320 [Bacillus sp. SJS]